MGQYLIRVEGRLSDEFVASVPTLDSSPRQQTVLHGAITDESTLTEILEHLRHIGVDVLDVHRVRSSSALDSDTDRDQSDSPLSPPV
jgi:hypothetical protein